ncbi:MAG TPA: hypothetical protein VFI09_09385 [Solirubrobacterales bacterium]|nr:hypothetical protein [Solirubrobacterales bacterium]
MPRPRASVAAVVFALLVLATIAAFAWSQRLKRDPLVLDRVGFRAAPFAPGAPAVRAFTPGGCRFDRMRIRFRTTVSDRAHVQVVEPGGKLVVTLARDTFLKRYRFHTFYWDGRTHDDGIAPPGRYKLRVKLLGQERTLVPGGVMRLHPAPPGATQCHAAPPPPAKALR